MTKKDKFEAKYTKLEEILNWFESDDFDLDEAENKFDESMRLVEELSKRLSASKLKISKLETKLEKNN